MLPLLDCRGYMMNLLYMKELLERAEINKTAVAAINVSNMETIKATIEGAAFLKAPIILQIAPIQIRTQGINWFEIVEMIKLLGKNYKVDIAIHLDHAKCVKDCLDAVDAGFTSVMYDGSEESFEENIKNTKLVVAYAKEKGVTVEGEIGRILGAEGGGNSAESLMTNPTVAKMYVMETGIDCLAVSIGNAHGEYKEEPKLNFKLLKDISREACIPLVLHGGTGIPDKDIKEAISLGIRKINFFTEVDMAFMDGFIDEYNKNNKVYMMFAQEKGRSEMTKKVIEKIKLCSSLY